MHYIKSNMCCKIVANFFGTTKKHGIYGKYAQDIWCMENMETTYSCHYRILIVSKALQSFIYVSSAFSFGVIYEVKYTNKSLDVNAP